MSKDETGRAVVEPQPPTTPLVSIIIPALNEENNFARLERELLPVVDPLPYRFEFIVIDNASTDRTGDLAKALCKRDQRWKYLRFSRNFEVEMSITAAYRLASGDAMIVLYSDLHDRPEWIPRFLEVWQQGYDVVSGVRTIRRGDPRWRNALVRLAYRVIAWTADVSIPTDTGDFKLITRQVRDALETCGEYNRYLRGLIAWLGFRQTGITYERRPRTAGQSKAPFLHLVLFAFDAITSFSLKPLRIFTLTGFVLLMLAGLASVVYGGLALIGRPPPGITTIIVLLLFAIGLNSLGIGVLGEYLGRTYAETKRRPLYIVQESMNLETEGPESEPSASAL